MRTAFSLLLLSVFLANTLRAQQQIHPVSATYEWPTDTLVKEKLSKWQDQKFGMIIHWGLYSVAGIVESWALNNEPWVDRDSTIAYDDFKKWYWGLKKDFNPVQFNPEEWASIGKDAGMRYIVFTTKHHDGFCMFDTKQTDYKISNGPFAGNKNADVVKSVFNAFRNNGFMIGAYYSKPDWHSEYYWWPKYATADRNNNYDIRKYPWRWNHFKDFTYNQLSELMHNYGAVDILWLDGGWVRPRESVTEEVLSWGAAIPEWSQDIDMPRIATMARKAQPGILMVDRTVHGPYENYQTPEQRVPDKQLSYPWESCMTLANNWGYVPGDKDKFKSSATVIHTLAEIVAKGGSLLLGIGPKPDGTFPEEATQRLAEIGNWMKVNGTAIYNTRTVSHYQDNNVFFTQNKQLHTMYAIACLEEGKAMPASVQWTINLPVKGSKVICLQTGKPVKWSVENGIVKLQLPEVLLKQQFPALAFSFTQSE